MTSDGLSDALVQEFTAGLRSALGGDLLGLYLYGSAVSGGFDAGVSDVDLLAVTSRDVDEADIAGIEALHRLIVDRHPEWDDRLEVVYVGRQTLAVFRTGGSLAVISPGEPSISATGWSCGSKTSTSSARPASPSSAQPG